MKTGRRRRWGWRAAGNLAAVCLVAALCWWTARLPLRLTEQQLRQDAQAQGVAAEELDILWQGNLPVLCLGGGHVPGSPDQTAVVLAQGGGRLWSCWMGSYEGEASLGSSGSCPETGAPMVVTPLLSGRDSVPTGENVGMLLLAAALPEEAAGGELVLETRDGQRRTARGEREQDVILFPISGEKLWEEAYGDLAAGAPYVLTLLDSGGEVLSVSQGSLPQA